VHTPFPSAAEIETFVREHATIASTACIPELQFWLATEITPLWGATESWLRARGIPPPFWAFAWAGGQALARYVLDRPEVVRGRRVVDFASGSGLVAIAAARAGAAEVVATEIDPFAEVVIRMNAALNGVQVTVTRDDLLEACGALRAHDVLFAGDVCYERPMAERVAAFARERARAGVEVFLGDPGRAYLLPPEHLEEVARYDVPVSSDVEGDEVRHATVWRVRP
jgi:predicted nicotinamide N-methyase